MSAIFFLRGRDTNIFFTQERYLLVQALRDVWYQYENNIPIVCAPEICECCLIVVCPRKHWVTRLSPNLKSISCASTFHFQPQPRPTDHGVGFMANNGKRPRASNRMAPDQSSQGDIDGGTMLWIGQNCDVTTVRVTGLVLEVWPPLFPLASTWSLPYYFERFFMAPKYLLPPFSSVVDSLADSRSSAGGRCAYLDPGLTLT